MTESVMEQQPPRRSPHVVIVGGGLAGLAAAEALSGAVGGNGQPRPGITVVESKRCTGGRAGSFTDATSGQAVDYCQHVAMGCCTNLIGMLESCGLLDHWKRISQLNFHHPDHAVSRFAPSRWLPAPLHLAQSIGGLRYLTSQQKRQVKAGLWRLMRTPADSLAGLTADRWLRSIGQSPHTIRAFWDVILVSALGESTDVVSMRAARKVLIDGFAAAKGASDVLLPTLPLSQLFGQMLPRVLSGRGVRVRCGKAVKQIQPASAAGPRLHFFGGEILTADHIVLAIPWFRLPSVFADDDADRMIVNLPKISEIESSPITGIHLWLDRPLMPSDHAVMVGTTSQWVFRRPFDAGRSPEIGSGSQRGHYHQVVISASRSGDKGVLLDAVLRELRAEFPGAADFHVLHHRLVTDPHSVFSLSPETERVRRLVRPAPPWLQLAGDWTDTGWPATMESAVISGRAAAAAVLQQLRPHDFAGPTPSIQVDAGLTWGKLSRWIIRR